MEDITDYTLCSWTTSITLPDPNFHECRRIISELEEHDYKPAIVLVRYGAIPCPSDTTLWGKLTDTLFDKLYTYDRRTRTLHLSQDGLQFFSISTKPIISSSIISMVSSQIPSQQSLEASRHLSVSKEVSVMESSPHFPTIKWRCLFDRSLINTSMGEGVPINPNRLGRIQTALFQFRRSMNARLLWPYSTRRGVSFETARIYDGMTQGLERPWHDEETDKSNIVSSRDIVSLFLHYGIWTSGDCELKQKWYPSGLIPRTYFAQGGEAIRVSCYLRDFFNDLCDCFIPTDRYARVDGSRLYTYDSGYFFIYDLTSFTSNFHEQYSFLCELAEFFRGTIIYLVSAYLSVTSYDLGDLVQEYADTINLHPRYRFSPTMFEDGKALDLTCIHHVAGFLGVPGNLASCTLAHGTLLAQHVDLDDHQSCAGDDGCLACRSKKHQQEMERTIQLLGIFQPEKGSSTQFQQAASYLKRRFVQNGRSAVLIQRIEFIMMSVIQAYRKPDPRFPELSQDRSKLRSSIAKSVVSFIRSLYIYTNGVYLRGEKEFILDFLQYVYSVVDLPREGQLRGMLLDEADVSRQVKESLVYPLSSEYLDKDPDLLISERFLPWVVAVPETTDIKAHDFSGDWLPGEERLFQMNPIVEKLVKYGWLSRKQTTKKYLVGPEGRKFFRRLLRDEIRELEYSYTCIKSLTSEQLFQLHVYERGSPFSERWSRQSQRIRKHYVDLDLPHRTISQNLSSGQFSQDSSISLDDQDIGLVTLDY